MFFNPNQWKALNLYKLKRLVNEQITHYRNEFIKGNTL